METFQKAQKLMQLQQDLHCADQLTTGYLQTDLTQLQTKREECNDDLLHKIDLLHAF